MDCPCGSNNTYSNCCEPIITGKALADSAEKLMRARYTAFAKSEINFLKDTLAPESRSDFDIMATKKWAKDSEWLGLKIIKTEKGTAKDSKGMVEFIATYKQKGKAFDHHEVSQFRKDEQGHWLFIEGDGHTHNAGEDPHKPKPQTVVRENPKVGRNDPCPCGSGKKYKKCCGINA
jgi:SEC-C motif-containing protein